MQNDKIRALNEREKAREKLPVFYGSFDNYKHGLREVLNNGIDEILNHFDNGQVDILLHDDLETITVKDCGRGICIQEIDENGIPYYQLIFETLFASGKYDENDANNSGVNGLGTCILNYSSEFFNVEVANQGNKYIIEYENGGYIKTLLTNLGKCNDHYTKITFKLDKSIYTKTTYTYEEIRDLIDRTSKVSPNITLSLTYNGNTEIFHHDTLLDYFDLHINNNLITPYEFPNKLYEEQDGEKTQVQLVLSCSNDEILLQECMLNGNHFIEKSSIHEGILNSIKNFANKYAKDNNLYKAKEKPINNNDVENSIAFCCLVLSNRVEFRSQTKFSTDKKLYKDVVQKYIQEMLEIYSIENKEDFIRLVNQILICKRAYEKSNALIESTKKKLTEKADNIHNRIEGLIDSKEHGENSELFITEGKSALGSVISSRNPILQAGYGIRGKILSCLKASYEKIFSNEVVMDLCKILGCGVEVKSKYNTELGCFDINKLNFGRIVLATDFDFDGESIQVLLLTMFYRLMPQLIIQEKIFIAQTPKYVIRSFNKNKEEITYAFSDEEKDKIIKTLKGKFIVSYIKGLSELDPIDMYNTALNPSTRKMVKVTVGMIEKMIEKFEMWMDDDVTLRKEFITQHLHEYINDLE